MFQMVALLLVLQFLKSFDGRLYCDSRNSVVGPGTASCHFHERITMPDARSLSLHHGLPTEGASVCGMLADFNFLQHFPEGGTIMGPIFTDSSDPLVVLIMSSHKHWSKRRWNTWATYVALVVKNPSAHKGCWLYPWVRKIPRRSAWEPTHACSLSGYSPRLQKSWTQLKQLSIQESSNQHLKKWNIHFKEVSKI